MIINIIVIGVMNLINASARLFLLILQLNLHIRTISTFHYIWIIHSVFMQKYSSQFYEILNVGTTTEGSVEKSTFNRQGD